MNTVIKSFLILFLFVQMLFVFDTKPVKSNKEVTLSEYMKERQAKRKLAWERIQNMEVKPTIRRAPAVEPIIATEDYSNYRRPAVLPNP